MIFDSIDNFKEKLSKKTYQIINYTIGDIQMKLFLMLYKLKKM